MAEILLPWGAWYEQTRHRLPLPERWRVDWLPPQERAARSPAEISGAIRQPIDSPPLSALASGCRSACIAVDDLARPTRAVDVLGPILEELQAGGLADEAIRIVVATGSHGALSSEQLRRKVGDDAVDRFRVECHNCRENLARTGLRYGSDELRLNRTFWESDLKMAVGSVLPHSFAGYSGGAKLVLPGLADVTATARSHKFVQMGLRGGSNPNENRFRLEAEDLARQIGLRFAVCVVVNSRGETAAVHAGDIVAAHRQACAEAAEVYRTRVEAPPYDCLILNAYPKDVNLIQAENVFVSLKTAARPLVKEDGVIVLATAASEGVGRHGLFEPGGVSYRRPARKRALGRRELWLYVPALSASEVHKVFWEGYPVFDSGDALGRALQERFAGEARAAVLPCAPMQQVETV